MSRTGISKEKFFLRNKLRQFFLYKPAVDPLLVKTCLVTVIFKTPHNVTKYVHGEQIPFSDISKCRSHRTSGSGCYNSALAPQTCSRLVIGRCRLQSLTFISWFVSLTYTPSVHCYSTDLQICNTFLVCGRCRVTVSYSMNLCLCLRKGCN
jgi:hypothetical protein